MTDRSRPRTATPEDIPPSDTLVWATLTDLPGPDADDTESTDPTDVLMADRELHRVRTLVELHCELPLDATAREGIATIAVRPYTPADADQLLEVNNAAFAWHPEQGGWDLDRLDDALAQDWVDPAGILVHEDLDGELDGFCWTREHMDSPARGEIWVIGAHPRRHGTGLGPALVAAGLDHLADNGFTLGSLFTEEANLPARRMYDRMGFHLHERRGGYR